MTSELTKLILGRGVPFTIICVEYPNNIFFSSNLTQNFLDFSSWHVLVEVIYMVSPPLSKMSN